MKNLHIIATDKDKLDFPFIAKNCFNNNYTIVDSTFKDNCELVGMNIYITNDEEIKEERCWVINSMDKIESVPHSKWGKLIILTTDQDLIKDGVQAIDDEFLEWFVKNPSCEEVDVNKSYGGTYYIAYPYKISIPKDYSKIKEGLEKSIKGKEHFVQHFKNGGTVEDFKPTEENCTCTDECLGYLTKTCKGIETLEEAFDRVFDSIDYTEFDFTSFEQGAKWKEERSYSEDEVLHILDTFWDRLDVWYNEGVDKNFSLREWFNECELKKK